MINESILNKSMTSQSRSKKDDTDSVDFHSFDYKDNLSNSVNDRAPSRNQHDNGIMQLNLDINRIGQQPPQLHFDTVRDASFSQSLKKDRSQQDLDLNNDMKDMLNENNDDHYYRLNRKIELGNSTPSGIGVTLNSRKAAD